MFSCLECAQCAHVDLCALEYSKIFNIFKHVGLVQAEIKELRLALTVTTQSAEGND